MDERQSKPFVVERWMVVGVVLGESFAVPFHTKEVAESFVNEQKDTTILAIEHVKWTYDET